MRLTFTLRKEHLAVLGAFLAGLGLVAAVTLLTRDDGPGSPTAVASDPATASPAAASTTPEIAEDTPTPRPRPSPTQTPFAPTATATSTPYTAPSATATAVPTDTPRPPPTRAEPGAGYAFIGAVWPDDAIPVAYCVNPSDPPVGTNGAPIMSAQAFAAAVQRAFQAWQDVAASYISFTYTGICDNDPFDRRDGVNTVGWGWLYSSAIGVAGPSATHGKFLRQSSFGQIYEMDLAMDIRYAQSFDDESEYVTHVLPNVILHEVGHFVGLDHSSDPCSIMQPVIQDAPAVLCTVDAAGAAALYPAQ